MFYLATLIGYVNDSQPMTDNLYNLNIRMPIGTKKQINFINREYLRRNVINKLFPVPHDFINVNELYDFKLRNEKQLKNFRKYIEGELLTIDSYPEHLKDEKLQCLLANIEDEKRSISEKMKERWNILDTGTLLTLTSNVFTLSNAFQTGTQLAIAGAATTIINTVISTITKVQKNTKDALNSPLAYAFLFEKQFRTRNRRRGIFKTSYNEWNYY
jgi:hypothetical protein